MMPERAMQERSMIGQCLGQTGALDVAQRASKGAGTHCAVFKRSLYVVPFLLLATSALADVPVKVEDDYGVLNPDDTGKEMIIRKIEMGIIDSVTCSLGINVTKNDDHEMARELTRACADAGFTKAMTWMSQLENNGLGGAYNPDASAEWDQRAAEAGDPVGKFNHGLNLMRGHGTPQDEALGRQFVDEAARDGLAVAKRLQEAAYDLDEVTPDADVWKYAPLF